MLDVGCPKRVGVHGETFIVMFDICCGPVFRLEVQMVHIDGLLYLRMFKSRLT